MPNGNLDTEKYKQELMRLYSRSTSAEEKQVTQPVPEEINDTDTEAPDDTVYAEHTAEDSNGAEEDYNSRFPEPDLSELDTDLGTHSAEDDVPPVYDSDELLGTERGYILVNVRTGDDSSAVAGAFIAVTAIVDGKRLVLASGVTDESGVSPKFSLPVPDREHSQEPSPEERPYNLFDVSVSAEGFFRARSVDVPVFSGITSVQNFNLIPLPLMMDSSDETVTYYNAEPSFGGGKE
ncbi:carboxypeptidase regulatory-like domain-containing protein [Ruminococcus sp.]|uniref:carboxypeptidase regulatory-like domain-containing protein n=1 Tax=Ruminococcus sp. TaxID=41978 RepID=UPI0025D6C454|nr:carboxypeptidase regulatory-like domain-containing protein [Ruminococcus sp.]MBR1433415.1 carboxypeptidase regulatory-like domain-containing protein [Ruminococcus sp.]